MNSFDHNLYRGPHPQSYATLRAAGIKTVINLQASLDEIQNESIDAAAYGITYYAFPCVPLLPPKVNQVNKILSVLSDQSHHPVYLHCKAGVDRTGYVVATYQINNKAMSRKDAIKQMRAAGMHFWYYWWSIFLP